MNPELLTRLIAGLKDGSIVPYLGPGVLADVASTAAGAPMPATSDELILGIIVDELKAVRDKFSDVRRTDIIEDSGDFRVEDLIADEDVVITSTQTGYIKRSALDEYRKQRRGGKGLIGMQTREEDVVRQVLLKKGVPAGAIEYFGKDLISTAAEAQAARALFARGSPKLLVVTSPYHLRRARLTFADALPAAEIRVIATSYDPLPLAWWKDQSAARNVLMELAKITFYQLGGRY